MARPSAFVTGFDPGKPYTEFHWRPGSDWDLDRERHHHEMTGEHWLFLELAAIAKGQVKCGGCWRPLARTCEAVLITAWDGSVSHNRIETVSYCLECVQKHGEEIAGPVAQHLNG